MTRFGVLGCAAIAERMMIPAMQASADLVSCAGIASRDAQRAAAWAVRYGCRHYPDYASLLADPDIDAVYIPLPPALHKQWAEQALLSGKHVLCEKPLTTTALDSARLIALARERQLGLLENYMFLRHRQMGEVRRMVSNGTLGEIRLVRATFCFPPLSAGDIRYCRELGGGSLLDAGGYTLAAAAAILGPALSVVGAALTTLPGVEVDASGSVLLATPEGRTAQLAFGFGHHYQCELVILGSAGKLTANRFFTAPPGMQATLVLERAQGREEIIVPGDNHFANVLREFACRLTEFRFEDEWERAMQQATLVDTIRNFS